MIKQILMGMLVQQFSEAGTDHRQNVLTEGFESLKKRFKEKDWPKVKSDTDILMELLGDKGDEFIDAINVAGAQSAIDYLSERIKSKDFIDSIKHEDLKSDDDSCQCMACNLRREILGKNGGKEISIEKVFEAVGGRYSRSSRPRRRG